MFRALAANLIAHERIETTDAKAKELRRIVERLVTRAVRLGPIAYTPKAELSARDSARRQAALQQMNEFLRRFHVVPDGDGTKKIDLLEKVFIELAQRYRDRKGGYTRIVKLGRRRGDNAPMSIIEFVDSEVAKRGGAKPAVKVDEPTEGSAAEPAAEKKPTTKKAAKADAKPSEGEAAAAAGAAKKPAKKKAAKADDAAAGEAAAPKKRAARAKKPAGEGE
jgi:large subunit ribosomal protein L17